MWIGDVLGLGAGVSIGWKGDWVTAQNGDITLSRYPLLFWLQALVPISERWYIVVSGGGHKEFDTHLSGSGVASGINASLDSPLGMSRPLTLHARVGKGEVALGRWPTTIGGWKTIEKSDGNPTA